MIARTRYLSCVTARIAADSCAGTLLIATAQPNGTAADMMNTSTPFITSVSASAR